MCSNPGGGTSQYSEGFLRLEYFFFSARGERERLRSRDLDLRKKIANQFNTRYIKPSVYLGHLKYLLETNII